MIYEVNEKPKYLREWVLYTMQMVLAVFVATVLIANICGTPISSCLFGACFGTLIYQLITKFKSPMFISSCGATVSAVCGALALSETKNYLMVMCGGLVILAIYTIFAMLFKIKGAGFINKFLPSTIVGAVTIVIGLNLAAFEVTYTHNSSVWEVIVAISVMFVVALSSHYFKGFMKTIPFLFGIGVGYIFCLILTSCGVTFMETPETIEYVLNPENGLFTKIVHPAIYKPLIDFSVFNNMHWYPDFTFLQWRASDWSWNNLMQTVLYFLPVALCAICEHISDHKTLSNIIGHDLIDEPGLDRTLIGDGVASTVGTILCGLPNTSYGESIATIGFSRVASVWISTAAAICIGSLSFLGPVTAFIETIPSCVFGGCALVLYGYIASSGLKTLINNKVDLNDNKNLTIVSVVLCTGVGGIFLFNESFAGVSLAMVLGIILNLILKVKNKD